MDRGILSGIWSTSRWLFGYQLGVLLMLNVDLILVNLLLGPAQVGAYAPLVQWAMLLRAIIAVTSSVLGPPLVTFYARGEFDMLRSVLLRSVKVMALLIGLPVGLLVGFSEPIIHLWLGARFAPPAGVTWLLLIPLVLEAAAAPRYLIGLAADKVPGWAYATLGSGLTSIAFAWIFVKQFHLDLFGVAAAVAAASLIRNGGFATYFTAKILDRPRIRFLGLPVALSAAFCVAEALAAAAVARMFGPHSATEIILWGGITGLGAAMAAWFFMLSEDDRGELLQLARGLLPKTKQ